MRTQRSSPDAGPLATVVAHRRAGECPLDVTLHFGQRVRRHEVLQRLAEQIVDRGADVGPVGLVGEAQAQGAVEVENRQPDAVRDDAQAVLALAGLELQPLDGVDVGIGGEQAANVSARTTIGVIVDADPEGVALGA